MLRFGLRSGGSSWLILVLWCALSLGCARATEVPAVLRLTEAQFWLSEAQTPAPPHDGAETIALPDRWSVRRPTAYGTGWYRFEVPPRDASEPYALLLTDLNMNAEAFVNGMWIGSGGAMTEPVAQHWNRPLLFTFDGGLLKDGGTIDIRLFAYAGDWGGLGPPLLGPERLLRPAYELQRNQQVVPAQVASVVAIIIVVLFTALFFASRRKPAYGYFALAAGCFFVHSLAYHLRTIVVPFWLGRWAIHAALDWYAVFQLRAFHRWLGIETNRLERAILAIVVVGSVATALAGPPIGPPRWFIPTAVAFHIPVTLLLPYAIVQTVRRWKSMPRGEAIVILIGAVAVSAVAFHALVAHLGWLPQNAPRFLFAVGPVLLFCFGALMLADFLEMFRTAQELNIELDRRVQAREAELEKNHERLRKLEGERILAGERERIMREMHDGMGNSLVSTLSLLERDGTDRRLAAGALREALVDMRVVVDSLDPSADDLATMLGMLRSRLEPRLTQQHLVVRWGVSDLPAIEGWGPQHTLHVMRIVQEAITNVLKHADAKVLGVATSVVDGEIFVQVWDDGRGRPEDGKGRGLENMRTRARALRGRLTIEPRDGGGTEVTLRLPRSVNQPSSSVSSPRLTAS